MTTTTTPQITEQHLREAIVAAETGHLNGHEYDQSTWCGTACCVLGFARIIAGLDKADEGPRPGEIEDTPWTKTIVRLLGCGSPDILRAMQAVDTDGCIDLSNANLRDVDLSGADLRGANLRNVNLRNVNLRGANLRGANLRGANLYDANLRGTDLHCANLHCADLRGADLRNADLRDVDFTYANLTDTNFDN